MADVIELVEQNGGNWRAAVADVGLDADAYLYRDRSADAFLPWQIIDGGLKTSFFRSELGRATAPSGRCPETPAQPGHGLCRGLVGQSRELDAAASSASCSL